MTGPIAGLRGAIGFLTTLPVPTRDGDLAALARTPAAFPIVGFVVGTLAAIPFLAGAVLPAVTVAVGYLVAVYLVTGIHHLDGVADLGDAVVVHGDAERRREVLTDTTTGVGAQLAVALVVVGLALGAVGLAGIPLAGAVAIVVAAEVGAKLTMALMAGLGQASHAGMGQQFTSAVTPSALVAPTALAIPAAALSWPHPASVVAICGAIAGASLPWRWAERRLEGVSGDIFGAANEIGRLAGIHVGVIAWTLW